MRLHRFYISEPVGLKTELTIDSPELVNQIRRVFRLKTGDSIVIFDGSGFDYECTIDFPEKKNTIVSNDKIQMHVVATKRSAFFPVRKVFLYAAVVKKDTFEWIVEKATELGVTDIIPVMAERSEKKSLNEGRLKKIAVEASEQSGRGTIPNIHPIVEFKEAVTQSIVQSSSERISGTLAAHAPLRSRIGDVSPSSSLPIDLQSRGLENKEIKSIAFHLEGESLKTLRSDLKESNIACFIGPEGGWSESEIDLFHKNKIPIVSLGSQVLRAETAVIATLSLIMFGE